MESATKLYSTIPLPAYTSRDLIHITPLIETWKDIFLSTTKGLDAADTYYNELDIEDVAVIAAHELTHHSDFFHSEFDNYEEENMWFEEGMCFYIPRKLILSENKFNKIMDVERILIQAYKDEYGEYSLDQFGQSGCRDENSFNYSAAFYDYWRSTITINQLIEEYCNGDLQTLIDHYREWVDNNQTDSLQAFFINTFQLSQQKAKELWLAC